MFWSDMKEGQTIWNSWITLTSINVQNKKHWIRKSCLPFPTFPGEARWSKRGEKTASRHFVLRADGDHWHRIPFISATGITCVSGSSRAPKFDHLNWLLAWSALKDGFWPDEEEEGEKEKYGSSSQSSCPEKPENEAAYTKTKRNRLLPCNSPAVPDVDWHGWGKCWQSMQTGWGEVAVCI